MIGAPAHEVKELTLSYIAWSWPPRRRSGRFTGVRWVGLVPCFIVSIALAGPRASNPAFLGIRMHDAGGRCVIEIVTHDGPAENAGLRPADKVLTVDGKPIASCNALLAEITARSPGDTVEIKVERDSAMAAVVARAQLTTRDALLRKVIGKPMAETHFAGVEDGTIYDLSALNGRMAIVGLYNPSCGDCPSLFTKFLAWSRAAARKGGTQPLVLAITAGESFRDLKALQRTLDVPLAAGDFVGSGRDGDGSPFSRELVIADPERLGVIVIDGRGIVQYLGPIAPNSDDTEAVLEEVFAVAEHALRRSG